MRDINEATRDTRGRQEIRRPFEKTKQVLSMFDESIPFFHFEQNEWMNEKNDIIILKNAKAKIVET